MYNGYKTYIRMSLSFTKLTKTNWPLIYYMILVQDSSPARYSFFFRKIGAVQAHG